MAKVEAIDNSAVFQPIIRGIQNVGAVQIYYRYNYIKGSNYYLPLPPNSAIDLGQGDGSEINAIDLGTGKGIPVAGFRLDSEFLRANPQIASSFTIPILGGGGVSLTNNNRTGTLALTCTRVAPPDINSTEREKEFRMVGGGASQVGVKSDTAYWDMVTLAQIQQAQMGGDAHGALITIVFKFCGVVTTLQFEGVTVATVDPVGLAGNDAVNYQIVLNYLNWTIKYDAPEGLAGQATPDSNDGE